MHALDAEWLIDNFHVIEDSLREVHLDLPPGYDEQLPKLGALPWPAILAFSYWRS